MLTPTDRSNFSGAWFIAPWNYRDFQPQAAAISAGAVTEELGRETGFDLWGDID